MDLMEDLHEEKSMTEIELLEPTHSTVLMESRELFIMSLIRMGIGQQSSQMNQEPNLKHLQALF